MQMPIELFTALGVAVVVTGILATMMDLVLLGVAVDDWYELRESAASSPEKMVADDELGSEISRLLSVLMTVAVGVLWVVLAVNSESPSVRITPLAMIIPATIAGQAVIACWQGAKGLLFRRKLARVLSGRRRSVATQEIVTTTTTTNTVLDTAAPEGAK